MEITEVKVSPVNEEHLKAYVTIILDHSFLIRDIKVIHGNSGLFVAMPSKKRKDGTFKDVAHPINSETRQQFEAIILKAYQKEIEQHGSEIRSERAPSMDDEEPALSSGLSANKESDTN